MNYPAEIVGYRVDAREAGRSATRFLRGVRHTCILAAFLATVLLAACTPRLPARIAVIPRTTGTILWEPENVGAQRAAAALGEQIYWNASSREDDVDGQIALVERVAKGNYKGLVLAPDHTLALITPVRRALAGGLPIVIVGSPLPIPASDDLGYVLNDESAAGRLAVDRVGELIHGKGEVALTGIDPEIAGIMARSNSVEDTLSARYPKVHISVRKMGSFNFAHEQEGAEEMLREHPDVDVVIALTASSMRGAVSAIENRPGAHSVKVIGFDPDSLPFENASLDSLIVQNLRGMGEQAIQLIHDRTHGKPLPARVMFQPLLITRENRNSHAIEELLYARWQPESAHLTRSVER